MLAIYEVVLFNIIIVYYIKFVNLRLYRIIHN
ncbi:hypothetical protein, partial [Plasmodium yoelii yoelii]